MHLLLWLIYIIFFGVCLSEIIDDYSVAAEGQRLFMSLKKKRQTEIIMDSVEGAWKPPCRSHFCELPFLRKWSLDEWLSLRQYSFLSTHLCLVLTGNVTHSSQLSCLRIQFFQIFVVWKLFWTCLLVLAVKVKMLGNMRFLSTDFLLPSAPRSPAVCFRFLRLLWQPEAVCGLFTSCWD